MMDKTRYPLTQAQQGLWFAQRLEPHNPAFNTAHVLWLEGELDIRAFTYAANQTATEAQSLALRFANTTEVLRQWLDPAYVPMLDVVDVSAHKCPTDAAQAMMRADYLTPLEPTRDRLAQQQLFILGAGRYAWYLRVHHLAADGYAMALMGERVSALYAGENSSRPFAALLPVLEEDADYQSSERRVRDSVYWNNALADVPPPACLSSDFSTDAVSVHGCWRKITPLDPQLIARLTELATIQKQPWPDVLTALTAEYCRRHTDGANEVVVGVPYMGRLGSKAARVTAMVMNVLPLVLREQHETLDTFINDTARELTRGRRHGRYRGEQLRRDLGLIGAKRRLYGTLINVQPFYRPLLFTGLSAQLDILSTGPVDDLALGFRGDAQAALDLEIEANCAYYTEADVEAHAARLPAFLEAAIDACYAGARLDAIALATPAETQRYLYEVNATEHAVPATTLVALYEAQMAATPDATALVFAGQSLSYAELEQRTRALACQLREQGVTRNSIVAVALPRSFELVLALVAIQRAGGAYLPLDAAQPDARLERILDSAQPVCVLAEDASRFSRWPLLSPKNWQLNPCQSSTQTLLDTAPQPEDAAYVIYTSGSTGEPKGVVVEHQAIVNRLLWMREYFAIDASERILQKTPATFDVSVWEFFLSLLAGAQLVIAPPDAHHDPRILAQLIREYGITTLHFVPSMLAAFLSAPNIQGLALRRVIVSGEALSAALRERFHAQLDAELFNLYGPTEAAVDVSCWAASRDDKSMSVPIGFPVWNTQLYVLDQQMRALPAGVAGDLYLGGVQLARGYLGQPALTAEVFIDNPFIDGGRLYKSGDVARFRPDGALEFLGRSDDQVKLRGLRIELGDIEHALTEWPAVASAAVLLRQIGNAEPCLVAYVQPKQTSGSGALEPAILRAHLAERLPDYMIPAAFVMVADWPLSANGKLNRKALPLPDMALSVGGELKTATEREVARLFAEVLDTTSPIGADDDFFALGGDSLLAVHLLLLIQECWHWDPGFGALFSTPTVAGLAALIDAPVANADDGLGPTVRLSQGEANLAPLFTIHPAGGIAWNYRELSRALSPARTVYGLQSPALDPQQLLPANINALAARYVDTLSTIYPEGPVHLVGWSVGGIIAHAMAICLREQGREVGIVALLDAYPAECWRAEPEPDAVAALRALLAIAGYDPEQHLELDSREKVVAFLRRGDSTLGNLPEAALDGVVRAVTGTNQLVRDHYHGCFDGQIMHFRAGRDHAQRPTLQASLWAAYAADIEAIELPYLHAQMTGRDAAADIAPLLSSGMAQHEAAFTPSNNFRQTPPETQNAANRI